MSLVLLITFYFLYNIWGCIVQLAHFSIGDWKDIYIYSSCYHHHYELIWEHWTYKCLSDIFCGVLSKIKYILSVIPYTICGDVCFSLPISLVVSERIYRYIYIYLSYYHHQIWSMNYYHHLGFSHETMVCAVCLSIFLLIFSMTLQVGCHRQQQYLFMFKCTRIIDIKTFKCNS